MKNGGSPRIAWLFPCLGKGNYWHPILSESTKVFEQTKVFTGFWPGFSPGYEDAFAVEVVGKTKYLSSDPLATSYNCSFIYASPKIVGHLLKFRPHVIFTSGFSMWTALSLLLKLWFGWRVVILYDGSSPGVDHRSSKIRLFARRAMARLVDGFCANSKAAKDYLTEVLSVRENRVFSKPYLVPQAEALLKHSGNVLPEFPKRPVFLFVGDIIPRKNLSVLLDACKLLKSQGCNDYSVLIVGDGPQCAELKDLAKAYGLADQIVWKGRVEYGELGTYFQFADAFVFPTLEDLWGMVVLEAMVFNKPVLCSKWAGAVEMVVEGENGYVFDPHQPEQLAELMHRFIEDPSLAKAMGEKSKQIISEHSSTAAAKKLTEVAELVMTK